MKIRLASLAVAAALSGCGGSGVGVPEQFAGTWGADCSAPWVKFDGGTMHDFPGRADYPITSAVLAGGELKVTYTRPDGEITDTYAADGATLRLTKTAATAGGEATWDKAPMSKCP